MNDDIQQCYKQNTNICGPPFCGAVRPTFFFLISDPPKRPEVEESMLHSCFLAGPKVNSVIVVNNGDNNT